MFNQASKLGALVFICFLATGVLAQGISDVYQVNYYSSANSSAETTVRIINTGQQGPPIGSGVNDSGNNVSYGNGVVCADIYVFDNTQEMVECCACKISANGLLELSLQDNLLQNPLTGFPIPTNGVVKIVSDNRANCDDTNPVPVPNLRAWSTHIQNANSRIVMTEDQFAQQPLQPDELSFLGQACSFVQYLGTGKGTCDCGPYEE